MPERRTQEAENDVNASRKATPLCEHWGHQPGEWSYACCACSGAPGGCAHCETDWDGNMLYPDGVIPSVSEGASHA